MAQSQATESRVAEIAASDTREHISEVISRVAYGHERVIVTRNGKPQAAIVSIQDLEQLKLLDRKAATAAVARMRTKAASVGAAQLSDQEIEAEVAESRKTRRRAR